MENFKQKLLSTFNVDQIPRSLFYNFKYALRFELGGETFGTERPIFRFHQAMDRARAVSNLLFEQSKDLTLTVACYRGKKPKRKYLKPFNCCGIKKSDFSLSHSDHIIDDEDFDDDNYQHWYTYPLADTSVLAETMWFPIAKEMGIQPTCFADIYFIDFERAIIFHIYDDRGMDIIAMESATLKPIYDKYYDWLLDYDIEQMNSIFRN